MLHPHCGRQLLLLAKDLISSERELLSQQKGVRCSGRGILLSLLAPRSNGGGDSVKGFLAMRELVLDDSCLTGLLELLVTWESRDDDRLAGEAVELLQRRTLNSGIIVWASLTGFASLDGGSGLLSDVTQLTKTLLDADSADFSQQSPLRVGDAIPASAPEDADSALSRPGKKSLSIMLSALEDMEPSGHSQDSAEHRRPFFLLGEELMRHVMQSCAVRPTPCHAQLLLLLCRASERCRSLFEETVLRDFCVRLRDSDDSASCDVFLDVVGGYVQQLSSTCSNCDPEEREKKAGSVGGALKTIRKLAMEKCVAIMDGSHSSFSEDQQV